ncbi:MAG: G/U mismatch-specific DNA glycosylase [Actinomycetota bacterium]
MHRKPTKEEVATAAGRKVPDLIKPGLRVLFCGINPGLYSGATGHHFARPGNRFWGALHRSGFTPHQVHPFDERLLLEYGLGVTNFVERSTARASDLHDDELRAGVERLEAKVARFKPRYVAFCGVSAYRVVFGDNKAAVGPQERALAGARVWLLPNPSGLNAHYQLDDLAVEFGRLRTAVSG